MDRERIDGGAERAESIEACIAHDTRLKRWHREWTFLMIETANPDWNAPYADRI